LSTLTLSSRSVSGPLEIYTDTIERANFSTWSYYACESPTFACFSSSNLTSLPFAGTGSKDFYDSEIFTITLSATSSVPDCLELCSVYASGASTVCGPSFSSLQFLLPELTFLLVLSFLFEPLSSSHLSSYHFSPSAKVSRTAASARLPPEPTQSPGLIAPKRRAQALAHPRTIAAALRRCLRPTPATRSCRNRRPTPTTSTFRITVDGVQRAVTPTSTPTPALRSGTSLCRPMVLLADAWTPARTALMGSSCCFVVRFLFRLSRHLLLLSRSPVPNTCLITLLTLLRTCRIDSRRCLRCQPATLPRFCLP
jgi:hypothetical protein